MLHIIITVLYLQWTLQLTTTLLGDQSKTAVCTSQSFCEHFVVVKSSQEFVLYKYHKRTYAHTHRLGLETAPSSPNIMALSNNAIKKKVQHSELQSLSKCLQQVFVQKQKFYMLPINMCWLVNHSLGNLSIEIN